MKNYLQRCYTCSHYTYYLTHPWCFVHDVYRDIKSVVKRGLRGYADCDVWNLYAYLSHILIHAVKDLQGGMGYPAQHGITYEEWQQVLKDISAGFEAMEILDNEISTDHKAYEEAEKKVNHSFDLLKKYFYNLWD